ncbi:uncharacterized protein TRAVEDRAFT_54643 [Trametes versicolor FP-101664 SS1]|uniref:Uncharacterized protein n=1 Tax=Trametes versicolor (strain FP-101664) TaxID=717944 RepID=R7S680_TRAVS|nr:uncharacterized protein TRAVEDRAFT_54643 [Trametes versicolor FP-101664 SS1]EIW51348.1 hypothetical protein TRAVEDRAFT_54643 [Trametes versicolor FP-101664 SS1]
MDTSTRSSFGTYLHELRNYSAGTKQTRLEIECCSSRADGDLVSHSQPNLAA